MPCPAYSRASSQCQEFSLERYIRCAPAAREYMLAHKPRTSVHLGARSSESRRTTQRVRPIGLGPSGCLIQAIEIVVHAPISQSPCRPNRPAISDKPFGSTGPYVSIEHRARVAQPVQPDSNPAQTLSPPKPTPASRAYRPHSNSVVCVSDTVR